MLSTSPRASCRRSSRHRSPARWPACSRAARRWSGTARPLFLGFAKGGKAVATAGGTILGVAPVVGADRRPASGSSSSPSPATHRSPRSSPRARCRSSPGAGRAVAGDRLRRRGAAAVIVLHRQNVRRLFAGTESRARPGGSSCARLLLERRHRQAGVLEPRPVELRLLAVAGPDDGLAVLWILSASRSPLVRMPAGRGKRGATPSNVLWLSLRTMTFHGEPSPVPPPRDSRSRVSGGVRTAATPRARSACPPRPPDSSSARNSPTVPPARRARRGRGSSRG